MLLTAARFLKPAQYTADLYDLEQPGLDLAFADCVEATLQRAMHISEAGAPIVHSRLQRVVRRFQVDAPCPYDLVATVLHNELVVAVAHHKREPPYWIERAAKRSPGDAPGFLRSQFSSALAYSCPFCV